MFIIEKALVNMGCICPKQRLAMAKDGKHNTKRLMDKDEDMTHVGDSSILSTRDEEKADIEIQSKDELDWYKEIKKLVIQTNIEELLNSAEELIVQHRIGGNGKLSQLLDEKKTDFSIGVYATIEKSPTLGSVHTYYITWTVPCTPEEFFYFNTFQDKETRKKIDSSCEIFDVLAAWKQDEIIFSLVYLRMAKFMIISGKESFYLKAMKKVQDDEHVLKWVEVNISLEHPSIPHKDDYKRINILKSGLTYTYDKRNGTTIVENYSHVVPQVPVGMLLLKPVLASYYKSYIKSTVQCIEKEREEKKLDYEQGMQSLLGGNSLKYSSS